MDVTKRCTISAKYGFESSDQSKFAVIEVLAKSGDQVKVNRVDGIRYIELVAAYESPKHEDHPIVDDKGKIVVIGGEEKESIRTICIIGK